MVSGNAGYASVRWQRKDLEDVGSSVLYCLCLNSFCQLSAFSSPCSDRRVDDKGKDKAMHVNQDPEILGQSCRALSRARSGKAISDPIFSLVSLRTSPSSPPPPLLLLVLIPIISSPVLRFLICHLHSFTATLPVWMPDVTCRDFEELFSRWRRFMQGCDDDAWF